jgi:hypothetical protein
MQLAGGTNIEITKKLIEKAKEIGYTCGEINKMSDIWLVFYNNVNLKE